jgi:hypothetical protein
MSPKSRVLRLFGRSKGSQDDKLHEGEIDPHERLVAVPTYEPGTPKSITANFAAAGDDHQFAHLSSGPGDIGSLSPPLETDVQPGDKSGRNAQQAEEEDNVGNSKPPYAYDYHLQRYQF